MPLPRYTPNLTPCGQTRREFLWQVGGGFAGLALIDLLSRDGFFTARAAMGGTGGLPTSAAVPGATAGSSSSAANSTTDHPLAPILNAAPKVVFSRTLKTADWANTTIAAGDTTEEIDKLRRGGDGHIVVWGGVSLWRSLMRLDLIDELRLSLFPYVAGEGTRLFDGVPKSYRLDLVSSTASSNGIVELLYRRHR